MLDGTDTTLKGMSMGVIVTMPSSKYPDDDIPSYNTHDAMYVDVIQNDPLPVGDSSPAATLPTYDDAAAAWLSASTKT